jgi:hypothetical protein
MLLGIPGELRNRIYLYLLSYGLAIRIHGGIIGSEVRPPYTLGLVGSHYAMNLTCRHTYQETLGLVFTYNALELHTYTSLHSALQSLQISSTLSL